ncbi:hypothetical protein OG884_19190 [Streptosporangium sp. NBC_01755]|uniref:hypothetical protein n=1 Tax=unclassified Streptosporangium TaxID=2632669 RepID=UPI002DDB10EC|nr:MULTISPECIES: hypothetical protein [unclassified Streptosporangium]WSA24882.1 hypothetical protein OIE13_28700 [Streptosporangium sp. NBC_01810]WSD03934.1 hypothetical protein OG884_19190 [Streptosporangium sp. NBC_01755]
MSRRSLRNNRYGRPDDRPSGRAGLLVRLWRWRTEIVLLAAASTVLTAVALSFKEGHWWPSAVLACTSSVPAASHYGRRWVSTHAWCLISRHRIRRACAETGIHTRSGRLPAVLWITPSAAGEKALILARAGICAEDFEAFSAEIASACYARDAVVLRHRRWAHLLTVEIVRRDEALASPMGLDRLYGRANWVSPRAGRTAREEPDTRSVAAPLPVPREPADHGQRAA